MTADVPAPHRFAAVAERLLPGGRVLGVTRLTGGVSAEVHALDLEGPAGQRRRVVVRQHGRAAWKSRHGQAALLEYELLQALHGAGLPVPEPLLVDPAGQLLPGPFLVMAFVDGSADVPPDALGGYLEIMAATLSRLHALPAENLPRLPRRIDPLPELFDYLPDLPAWRGLRDYLVGWADSTYQARPVLLHGDFWPANLLWRDGRLVAILDWEDAALGDPAADVAGCRLELLWQYGPAAMEDFTRSYARKRPIDFRRLALWEVFVASAAAHFMAAWGLPPEREAAMRRQGESFVHRAAGVLLA